MHCTSFSHCESSHNISDLILILSVLVSLWGFYDLLYIVLHYVI